MSVCTICLDGEPIQSGCACRGDAGLAHIECRAMAAAHLDCWAVCTTCGQAFTGAMQAGLAEAWWVRAQRLPAANLERVAAADNMASHAPWLPTAPPNVPKHHRDSRWRGPSALPDGRLSTGGQSDTDSPESDNGGHRLGDDV